MTDSNLESDSGKQGEAVRTHPAATQPPSPALRERVNFVPAPHSLKHSPLLPPQAGAARVIVCEASGRWAVALKREWADLGKVLLETRTLSDAIAALAASPASFWIAELTTSNAESLARLLAEQGRLQPLARAAVVADRSLARYEGWMIEAGAVCFAPSTRSLKPLVDALRRHLADAPEPPQTLAARVWSGLPWQSAAGK